jgi:hypothetical protein
MALNTGFQNTSDNSGIPHLRAALKGRKAALRWRASIAWQVLGRCSHDKLISEVPLGHAKEVP